MNLAANVVFEHLLESTNKITIEQGGTRSGKTYNILLWIIFYYCANNTGKIVTICRRTYPALRATVMRDFFYILTHEKYGSRYEDYLDNKSNSEYKLFGNLVEFISLDQPMKVRGRKRDLLFCNEINEIDYESWNQLIFRTSEKIICDYNPSEEYHWLYDKVLTRSDVDFHITNYTHNPFIEDSLKEEITRLQTTDSQYWEIYGLGQKAKSRATIFEFVECDQIPTNAKILSYGMDFGYTNDPTAFISTYILDFNLYVKEHLYKTHLTTNDIFNFLVGEGLENKPIYADSAEPRLIEELRRLGSGRYTLLPSVKGKDSINASIDLLKRYKIHILNTSDNLIREMRNYKWIEKDRKLENVPRPGNDHLIDSLRYSTYSILSKPNFGKYHVR